MNIQLKIKIKSLAAESRIIRTEELKCRKNARSCGEAYPQQRDKASTTRTSLHEHRTGTVRSEARYSQLAYGFLKDMPYRQMELYTRNEPDWDLIYNIAKRFRPGSNSISKDFAEWSEDGSHWISKEPVTISKDDVAELDAVLGV